MPYTYYGGSRIQALMFSAASFTVPPTWYVALSTTTPAAAGTGFTEPSGGGYGRVAVPNDTSHWVVQGTGSSSEIMQNAGIIYFPTLTATWGALTYWGVFDASSGGNLWGYGQLTSITPAVGATPSFQAGQLASQLT